MIYRRSPRFKKSFSALPKDTQQKVHKAFKFFRDDPQHPSLVIKKIKGRKNIWEGRIDDFYRFTFQYIEDPNTGETICLFRNIGRHEIIDYAP